MGWTQRVDRIAGILMLLLIAAFVLGFIFGQTPDSSRDSIAEDLQDVGDDQAVFVVGQIVTIVFGILVGLLAVALFVLLAGRDRFLALVGAVFFFGLTVLWLASSAVFIPVTTLAEDLEDGGAGGAGEAEIVEIARILVEVGDGLFFLGIYLLAVGVIAFGLLIARAPLSADPALDSRAVAASAPPRWMGWVALVGGVCLILSFLGILITDWLFLFLVVGVLLTIIWFASMGIWLLFMADKRSRAGPELAA